MDNTTLMFRLRVYGIEENAPANQLNGQRVQRGKSRATQLHIQRNGIK